jgi:hypothetical protein
VGTDSLVLYSIGFSAYKKANRAKTSLEAFQGRLNTVCQLDASFIKVVTNFGK